MEKSIESIWKEGFLNKDALVIPKLNDLYNRKSIHVAEKYKRMFKKNIILLFVAAFATLTGTFLVGMPYMGVPMFFMLNALAIVDLKLSSGLDKIDNTATCYQYLKSLNNWMIHKTHVNIIMARILYPYVFISIVLGCWFFYVDGKTLGSILMNRLSQVYPDMPLIFGIPTFGILGLIIIAGFLTYIAKRIYSWDIDSVYGDVLKQLENLMSDMEELRS